MNGGLSWATVLTLAAAIVRLKEQPLPHRVIGTTRRFFEDLAGAERVLFGSDNPLMDPRPQLGKIITADISTAAKRKILGENARRLLCV